ncbi:MAG TPA: polyketide synthase dehydratase domain-containing protein, partial [Longilinea sp.]|nr:polyketide synthase dehydratase domain-containing protein [Longilinea sp.]
PGQKVSFFGRIWSQSKNGHPVYHYSLNATLTSQPQRSPIHSLPIRLFADPARIILGKNLYQDGTLFHGPSFQGVKRVLSMDDQQVVMECMLPAIDASQQGQFPLQTSNPFIYDAIVQSLLIWTQYNDHAPCLPSHLDRLEHYRPIPFDETCLVDMHIVSHSQTAVVADIWVTDNAGEVYAKFIGLQGTISPALKRLISVGAAEQTTGIES